MTEFVRVKGGGLNTQPRNKISSQWGGLNARPRSGKLNEKVYNTIDGGGLRTQSRSDICDKMDEVPRGAQSINKKLL